MAGHKRAGDRPGIQSLLRNQAPSDPTDPWTSQRVPLFNQEYRKKQIGSVDLMPNLLMTTLAVVAAVVPVGKQLSDSAPQAKTQVQADNYRAPLTLGINPNPAPLQLSTSAPPLKSPVYAFQQHNILAQGINPNPRVTQQSDSAPRYLYIPDIDSVSSLNLTTLAVVVGKPAQPADFSQLQRKYEVRAEQPPRPLTLGINPNPDAEQRSESAPPRKYQVQVDVYPNLLSTTLAPASAVFPAGTQWFLSAPPLKAPVYAQQQHNTLAQGINPNPSVRQWSESAPAIKYQLRIEHYPELSVTTLAPSVSLPPGRQLFESAPPRKRPVTLDTPQNILARGINPNPLVQRLDQSAPWVKYRPQVDVYPDLLNTTLQQFAPAPVREEFTVPYEVVVFRLNVEGRVAVAIEPMHRLPQEKVFIVQSDVKSPKAQVGTYGFGSGGFGEREFGG